MATGHIESVQNKDNTAFVIQSFATQAKQKASKLESQKKRRSNTLDRKMPSTALNKRKRGPFDKHSRRSRYSWSCRQCTLLNKAPSLACKACGAKNKKARIDIKGHTLRIGDDIRVKYGGK